MKRAASGASILFTAALTATAARASDDAQAIAACLDDSADKRACIGTIAVPCADLPGGETTVGISDCLSREHDAWDTLLNRYWKPLMQAAHASDEAEAPRPAGAPAAAATLRAAQRAWIAFRDAECAHAAAEWGMGSMRLIAGADCMRSMTAERAIEFHDRLNDSR